MVSKVALARPSRITHRVVLAPAGVPREGAEADFPRKNA
jgi:hypothetical protein